MSTRVLTDLGEHRFSRGKEVGELLEKEGKRNGKVLGESRECHRSLRTEFQEEIMSSVKRCLKSGETMAK